VFRNEENIIIIITKDARFASLWCGSEQCTPRSRPPPVSSLLLERRSPPSPVFFFFSLSSLRTAQSTTTTTTGLLSILS
jgi:hypothetical protein